MARAVTLDTAQLARFLDITPRHVFRLTSDGVLLRARDEAGNELRGRYDLLQNNVAYIRHLRQQGRFDDASESEYQRQRVGRMRAENEMAQIRLRELKGEMHRASDVEFVMTNMITATKQRLLSIPSRVTRLLVGLTSFKKIFNIISTEIELALKEPSGYKPEMFARQTADYMAAQPAAVSGNGAPEHVEAATDATEPAEPA
jgi:phage terminase Nu1 subunit (DNA packaging protein)